jgi:hypothetical protein
VADTSQRQGSFVMFMLVRRPDGSPTGYPMTGLWRDGDIEFTSYRKAPKARYLAADDRVCLVIPDDSDPTGGVAVWGHARPTEEHGFFDAPKPEGSFIEVPASVAHKVKDRLESNKRMVFRVQIERQRDIAVGAATGGSDAQG